MAENWFKYEDGAADSRGNVFLFPHAGAPLLSLHLGNVMSHMNAVFIPYNIRDGKTAAGMRFP